MNIDKRTIKQKQLCYVQVKYTGRTFYAIRVKEGFREIDSWGFYMNDDVYVFNTYKV